jgi:hypothetical protein
MSPFQRSALALVSSFLVMNASAGRAHAQAEWKDRVELTASAGYLNAGDYFTGPGATALDNSDAMAVALQAKIPVYRGLAVVIAATHAEPEWRLTGVPLLGAVGLGGASLWFGDAALRGSLALGRSARPITLFGQVGAGAARYAVSASILGNPLEAHATNFAWALGAGLGVPIGRRVGVEILGKYYIASFTTVRDLEVLGVEGQRAHTLLALAGLSVSF